MARGMGATGYGILLFAVRYNIYQYGLPSERHAIVYSFMRKMQL